MSCPSCAFFGLPCDAPELEEEEDWAGVGCRSLLGGSVDEDGTRSEEGGAGGGAVVEGSGLKEAGPSISATSSLLDSGVSLTAFGCKILGS